MTKKTSIVIDSKKALQSLYGTKKQQMKHDLWVRKIGAYQDCTNEDPRITIDPLAE